MLLIFFLVLLYMFELFITKVAGYKHFSSWKLDIDRYLLMEKMAKCLCVYIGKILEITDKTI